MTEAIPLGETVFLDAMILHYHFMALPGLEREAAACNGLMRRIAVGELVGVTSSLAIGECRHKAMLSEAVRRYGKAHAGNAYCLSGHRDWVRSLRDHLSFGLDVREIGIRIEPIGDDLYDDTGRVIQETGILNNDATTVALMRRLGVVWLATNDDHFDGVSGLRIWKPG